MTTQDAQGLVVTGLLEATKKTHSHVNAKDAQANLEYKGGFVL